MMAFFVLTQAVVVEQQLVENKKEQADSDKSDHQQVAETIAIPSSSVQISLDYQSYLLGEVFSKEDEERNQADSKELFFPTPKAIMVILRRIISPNAP